MAFSESPRFPDDISYGSRGGPTYFTEIVKGMTGKEKRWQHRQYPLHEYNIIYGVKDETDVYYLSRFFHAHRARLVGFRFWDRRDYKSTDDMSQAVSDTDQTIGTGDTTEVDFQLIKTYTVGSQSLVRNITKPVSGTVVISLDDVSQPTGWTVDTTTGIVTFSAAPGAGVVVKAGFEMDVPCRFDIDDFSDIEWTDVDLLSTACPVVEIPIPEA